MPLCPGTVPTRFLLQEHHTATENFIQGINTPTTRETDHTPIIGDITADNSPVSILTMTEAAALAGTPLTLLSATTATCTTLQPMDAPVTPHSMVPTGKVTPHPVITISPKGATDATPRTGASLTTAVPGTEHKILSPRR